MDDDPAEQWNEDNVEHYAEVMFTAFTPSYLTRATKPGIFEPQVKTYAQLSEQSKEVFRTPARDILHRRDEWKIPPIPRREEISDGKEG